MRNYKVYPVSGKNSMQYCWQVMNPLKVMWHFVVIQLGRYTPSLGLKRLMYNKLLGMKIAPQASVGLMVMVDIFFPNLITIGEDSIIGYNCTILTHEYLQREYHIGPVQIGKNVLVGANCTILAGVTIGDGATVAACSLVNKDVPPNTIVGGVPIRVLGTNPTALD